MYRTSTCTKDHLGSITTLTSESTGTVLERYSYDAWGVRRSASDWSSPGTAVNEHRGYTGHEHLDDIGIIHMNGRLYAPNLGRMLSPDPVTQAPEYGQNYNRYSYAYNNPLRYFDPSGYVVFEIIVTAPGLNGPWNDWLSWALRYSYSLPPAYVSGGGTHTGGAVNTDQTAPEPEPEPEPEVPQPEATESPQEQATADEQPEAAPVGSGLSGDSTGDSGNASEVVGEQPGNQGSSREARLEYARSLTDPYVSGYEPNDPNFHDYDVGPDFVCFYCSEAAAANVAQAESIPLMLTPANQNGHGNASVLGVQPIINIRPADNISVNITREGHWFHKGSVVHATFTHGGAVWIYTRGVGTGANPGINAGIGRSLFGGMHMDVRGYFEGPRQ